LTPQVRVPRCTKTDDLVRCWKETLNRFKVLGLVSDLLVRDHLGILQLQSECYPLGTGSAYGGVSEKSITRQQAGLVRRAKTCRRNPADLAGASGGKFVVSMAGKAYDARVRGPNRKFRLI
jgi:hypothetical protein